ncbi:MAG: pyruvate kinase [Geminicoccaceae bacterium]|nr:pyruvate kinase [Geminicoccaceae bacterium]MCX7631591.1 pyruvate kinase [Geminicoccaceae bacterium]MDW8371955.1 pyruvate kinase [Geminicoccaceae bacterium]
MRRDRCTKIVATLGPASSTRERIRALVEAGADVFRFNFSHGSHDDHAARFALVREVEAARGRPIGTLMDLQGPKLRIGTFAEGRVVLESGRPFRLDLEPVPGDATRVELPHPEILEVLAPGALLLLDDGKIRLRVERAEPRSVETVVVAGGPLSDRKGVNVPGVLLPIPAMTEKDRRDLAFGMEQGFDWVALSFVQRPDDVAEAKRLVAGRAAVMAKIEKPSAIERLEEIVDLADGIMIARGDLGVELPPERVPGLQKRIVRVAREAGKPVVVATQMLESMITSPAPTRAEASDVATAVYDGADAVMLSAESASGAYPVEAVAMMDRIVVEVEHDALYRVYLDAFHASARQTSADAITQAAARVAHTLHSACIVTYTTSGATALRAARERPDHPILGLITRMPTARKLTLAWGIHPVYTEDARDLDEMVTKARRIAREEGFAEPGSSIVITAGLPFGTPGATNLLRVAWVT